MYRDRENEQRSPLRHQVPDDTQWDRDIAALNFTPRLGGGRDLLIICFWFGCLFSWFACLCVFKTPPYTVGTRTAQHSTQCLFCLALCCCLNSCPSCVLVDPAPQYCQRSARIGLEARRQETVAKTPGRERREQQPLLSSNDAHTTGCDARHDNDIFWEK